MASSAAGRAAKRCVPGLQDVQMKQRLSRQTSYSTELRGLSVRQIAINHVASIRGTAEFLAAKQRFQTDHYQMHSVLGNCRTDSRPVRFLN